MSTPPPKRLESFLRSALPRAVGQRLPPPELLAAWPRVAGEQVARRARPVCLDPGGVLVVAVSGAAWRQELGLAGPGLAARLRELGFAVKGLKLVSAATPAPRPPEPAPRELEPGEESRIAEQVSAVQDPDLRRALARAMRAQLRADPGRRR